MDRELGIQYIFKYDSVSRNQFQLEVSVDLFK